MTVKATKKILRVPDMVKEREREREWLSDMKTEKEKKIKTLTSKMN